MGDVVKKFMKASDLFIMPSFSHGTARVMDLFGSMSKYNTSGTASAADQNATARDWQVVGQDIKNAITDYESELANK